MKINKLLKFLIIAAVLTAAFTNVKAQDEPPNGEPPQIAPKLPKTRPDLLRELGLSREQMQAIRRLNAEKRSQVFEAQRKSSEARQNLDAAIYADSANDDEVKTRIEELQTAQMEVLKIRSTVEYEIRKILTPEQVVRFRQLRRRFAEMRGNFQNNGENRRGMRQNRFNNRQKLKN